MIFARTAILLFAVLPLTALAQNKVTIQDRNTVLYDCTKRGNSSSSGGGNGGGETPVVCKPSSTTLPSTKADMFSGKRRIVLQGGSNPTARAYRFNSSDMKNPSGVFFAAGEVSGQVPASLNNAISISECPGDFDYKKLGTDCVGGGRDPSVRVSLTGGHKTCRLKLNTWYWFSIAPVTISTLKSKCRNKCAVVAQGPDMK